MKPRDCLPRRAEPRRFRLRQKRQQPLQPRLIVLFHPRDMALKVAAVQKPCQRQLLERRHGAAVKAHGASPPRKQRLRQNHVADAKRGRDGFGEGVEIDDPAAGIEALQRRNRKPREAKFRVVVVLDQKPLLAASHPRQQLLPPGNRHNGSGRVLVRRRHVDNLRAACLQLCYADAAFVHRYRHDLRAASAVDLRQRPVAGVLDREALSAPKKLRQKRVKILCARADENLLRLDHKPALARQLFRNCPAQRKKPTVRHRLQQILSFVQNDASHQLCPHGKRKQLCRCVLLRFRFRRFCRLRLISRRRLCQQRHVRYKIARALA